jgi:2-oxoglutarate dehydrogenase E2 component (dihydrolipoamide succinyltransferase)
LKAENHFKVEDNLTFLQRNTAPENGILEAILEDEGTTVLTKQLLGRINPQVMPGEPTRDAAISATDVEHDVFLSPAVRRLVQEADLDASQIVGTGVHDRITKEDVTAFIEKQQSGLVTKSKEVTPSLTETLDLKNEVNPYRSEKRVPMTRLRKRVAERLLEAKNSTAMLTTFNEVNMKPIMDLRRQYKDAFEKRHDVRLGFMSFYVKSVVEALKRYPEINASIDGDDIVYHNFFDISIAVSTPRGLVTPVLRDCDKMSLADIEKGIQALALKGKDGKLTVDDLTGGNFTITNGGVFGSLMSTPIINPPQAAILGMHKIQDRPMAIDGKVVILPMMYLALSYDHRLVDGRESVGFLVTIKEMLEDPHRLLLDV